MGVYTRKDSPFYWIWLEREEQRGIAESTRVRADAPTAELRRDNRRLAEQIYHQRMAQLVRNELTPPKKPSILFSAYATWYLENVTQTRPNHSREVSMIRRLRAWFDPLDLKAIDREAVLEWRTKRLTEVSPATMDRELDVLKRMLALAVPKYLDASPIAGLRRHRETIQSKKRRPRILADRAEEERILAQARNAEERAIVILALDTLMRLSDLKNLRRDRDYGTYLHVEAPKIEPYDVELSPRARAALDALPVRGQFYFTRRRRGKPSAIAASTIWRMFKRMCEGAGVPYGRKHRGVTFHALRHTGATRMLDAGANPIAVMEQGGWSSLRQLVRYGRASRESKRRAAELAAGSAEQEPRHDKLPRKRRA